ncbi:MAG: protein translocase subunit SecD [Chloroflexota bacterium]|nr:protein translocase subunit SecD [Chloroflexota bacterium]
MQPVIDFFRRFRFRDAYIFAVILILTAFAIAASWPGNPDRYLPSFIPWPEGGGVSVGDWERNEFRLGLDLAGGVSITLEVAGEAAPIRRGESLNQFLEREGVELDQILSLNPELADLETQSYDLPLPDHIAELVLPLDVDDASLEEAVAESQRVIEDRVNGFGISEAEVTVVGVDRINAQIPGVDADEASDLVGSTALLEFRSIDPAQPQPQPPLDRLQIGAAIDDVWDTTLPQDDARFVRRADPFFIPPPDEDVIVANGVRWLPANGINAEGATVQLTGRHLIANSISRTLDQAGDPALTFEFEDEGARLMEQITRRLFESRGLLGIFVDGRLISSPSVNAVISDSGIINGLSEEDAITLRRQLRAGALPINLRVLQSTEVAATLGEDSVIDTVQAGVVAFVAIVIFMMIYYRVPGVVAALALIVYAAGVMATFKLVPITLTLAGVAGLVLSIGFAVDGNVLIFERLKEELRLGRSLSGAVETAWARAWPAIRDGNVSTIITVAILWLFADALNQNLIKSFALALLVGTGFSFVTVIFVTRNFMTIAVSTGWIRGLRPFGVRQMTVRPRASGAGSGEGGASA